MPADWSTIIVCTAHVKLVTVLLSLEATEAGLGWNCTARHCTAWYLPTCKKHSLVSPSPAKGDCWTILSFLVMNKKIKHCLAPSEEAGNLSCMIHRMQTLSICLSELAQTWSKGVGKMLALLQGHCDKAEATQRTETSFPPFHRCTGPGLFLLVCNWWYQCKGKKGSRSFQWPSPWRAFAGDTTGTLLSFPKADHLESYPGWLEVGEEKSGTEVVQCPAYIKLLYSSILWRRFIFQHQNDRHFCCFHLLCHQRIQHNSTHLKWFLSWIHDWVRLFINN